MKLSIKKIYFIIFFLIALLINFQSPANSSNIKYTSKNISNYFSGIILASQNNNEEALKYLKKVQFIKDRHSNFNVEFVRTLILLGKTKEAFNFAASVWKEDEFFFDGDLLLGLDALIKKNYIKAEKHFRRLNKISIYNFYYEDFFGNILMSWSKAAEGKKEVSFDLYNQIPNRYTHLKKIQNAFLQCHFNTNKTEQAFVQLTEDEDYNFSRYNFFLINYLLSKNEKNKAKKIIKTSRKLHNSNLLIKQTEDFISNKNEKKILDLFSCHNPRDVLAEFFYIMANLYASEKNYQLSNYYLKISSFLNEKFLPNKTLLAENFYFQGRYEMSEKMYNSIKPIGSTYSWYASTSIASILLNTTNKEFSISTLEKDFNSILSPSVEQYYELANFYKENEFYEKSIKYYSLALKNLNKDHPLVPKIFDRRGTSYERLGLWEKAEQDLLESLKIIPDQPHVLNYLAYTWIDKGINLDKGLEMLNKAMNLRENDGYIIDSVGWAYYAKENYIEAGKFLQRAVELLPRDPIINDHYADTLWMLNKNIQARYFWKYVLSLEGIEEELKDSINNKLIFGITKKL